MIAQVENRRYSPEEYLAFEVDSPEHHEYINGEISPMSGGYADESGVDCGGAIEV